jgi:anti-sigma regulatory factor (Ser/Thr protein kinase)
MIELSNDETLSRSKEEDSPDRSTDQTESIRSIVLTAQFENLDYVREFVGQAAVDSGMKPSAVYAVQLAVDEAFSNIIEHAYGGECLENVQCSCEITKETLVVKLHDCGQSFQPGKVPAPDLTADLQNRKIGGLGLYFMRQLMDDVDFVFTIDPETGRPCNILKMVKHRESKH